MQRWRCSWLYLMRACHAAEELLPAERGGCQRVLRIHAYVDGPIVTAIVDDETALSVYVFPQQDGSDGVALWCNGTGAAVTASIDLWGLSM